MKLTLIRTARETGKETFSTWPSDTLMEKMKTENKAGHISALRSLIPHITGSNGHYPCIDKLLTAIQRRSIVRVGSNTPVPVDIRLICATNRNLSEMADKGEFREDLLYRINTIHLEIPALRERQEDIIPLAERFITRFCKQYGKPALRLNNAAREKLMLHPWSGNIRELEHAIEKAVIICDGAFLSAGLFQLQRRNEAPEMPAASTLEDMEKQMIRHTLDKCGGNLSAVASQLGITRQTLYNKMKKYGL